MSVKYFPESYFATTGYFPGQYFVNDPTNYAPPAIVSYYVSATVTAAPQAFTNTATHIDVTTINALTGIFVETD